MKADEDRASADYSDPWSTWLDFCRVLHARQVEWCQIWARHCLPSFVTPHRHEGHCQLEIPDPLAESTEPELFA